MDLPFHADMIDHAIEREQRGQAWDLWSRIYWKMDSESFIPFEDFIGQVFPKGGARPTTDLKEWGEIEDEMDAVVSAYEVKKAVRQQ